MIKIHFYNMSRSNMQGIIHINFLNGKGPEGHGIYLIKWKIYFYKEVSK
jgi:hypothetical protein